jgi:phage I-like protein
MPSVAQAENAYGAVLAALPPGFAAGEPPEWVTVFPSLGEIKTRDGRAYTVDAAALIARFEQDGVDLPVDVNHTTHHGAKDGKPSPAVGWVKALRVDGGALKARIEWLAEGAKLLAERRYKFISPDFFHTAAGATTWLRSLALVTAPALANQAALASAQPSQPESSPMKELAAALGVTPDASEPALLAALKGGFVAKGIHDEAVARLSAAEGRLKALEDGAFKAKVDALLEGALKDKKILPADRDRYAALCADAAGLDNVAAILAAKKTELPASGLDKKPAPEGGAAMPAPALLAAQANKMVENGEAEDFLAAIAALETKYQAAA